MDATLARKTTPRKRAASEIGVNDQRPNKLQKTQSHSGYDTAASPVDSAYTASHGISPWINTPGYPYLYSSGVESGPLAGTPSSQRVALNLGQRSCPQLKECMRYIYKDFKEEVREKDLTPYLYQENIITPQDYEQIEEEKFRRRKNDMLIKAIVKSKKAKEISTFAKLLKRLNEMGCSKLVKEMEEFSRHVQESLHTDPVTPPNEPKDIEAKTKLHEMLGHLEKDLEPKDIIDDLLVNGMLSFDDHEDILTTDGRRKRVQILVDYVLADAAQNLKLLCEAMNEKYQSLEAQIRNRECNSKKHVPKAQINLTVEEGSVIETTVTGSLPRNLSMTINFNGHSAGVRKAEEEIVSRNKNRPQNEEIAMSRIRSGVENIDLCCVKVRLKALSKESLLLLGQLCNTDQGTGFMQQWLQSLLTPEAIETLKEAETTRVKIEFKASSEATKVKCHSRISKEWIVDNFTELAARMPKADMFQPEFQSKMRQCGEKDYLKIVNKNLDNIAFLKALLQLPDKYVCLFEKELWRLGKEDLITVLRASVPFKDAGRRQKNASRRDSRLSKGRRQKRMVNIIKQNYTFLLEEVDARDFPKAFCSSEINRDDIAEKIMGAETRKLGTECLLDFLLKTPEAVDGFIEEAKRLELDPIVDLFTPDNPEEDSEGLKEKILKHYSYIVDEVDPRRFESIMVERKLFSRKEFAKLSKSTSRSETAVMFMKSLMTKGDRGLHCFMDALEMSGYQSVVSKIHGTPEKYTECPCLEDLTDKCLTTTDVSVYSAAYEIQFTEGVPKETDLQLQLHKRLYGNKKWDVMGCSLQDKKALVAEWINDQDNISTDSGFEDRTGPMESETDERDAKDTKEPPTVNEAKKEGNSKRDCGFEDYTISDVDENNDTSSNELTSYRANVEGYTADATLHYSHGQKAVYELANRVAPDPPGMTRSAERGSTSPFSKYEDISPPSSPPTSSDTSVGVGKTNTNRLISSPFGQRKSDEDMIALTIKALQGFRRYDFDTMATSDVRVKSVSHYQHHEFKCHKYRRCLCDHSLARKRSRSLSEN